MTPASGKVGGCHTAGEHERASLGFSGGRLSRVSYYLSPVALALMGKASIVQGEGSAARVVRAAPGVEVVVIDGRLRRPAEGADQCGEGGEVGLVHSIDNLNGRVANDTLG